MSLSRQIRKNYRAASSRTLVSRHFLTMHARWIKNKKSSRLGPLKNFLLLGQGVYFHWTDFLIFQEQGLQSNYGRDSVRCKHVFWERTLKYHHFGSDFRSLIRENIESKSKIRTFRIVDSPGNNTVNPMAWRCRESAKLNMFVCLF